MNSMPYGFPPNFVTIDPLQSYFTMARTLTLEKQPSNLSPEVYHARSFRSIRSVAALR